MLSLGRIGAPALEVMARALRDPDQGVRRQAARALPGAGARAVPLLAEALGDEHLLVRSHALQALASLGEPAAQAIRRVLERLHDSEIRVRDDAMAALERLAPHCASYRDEIPASLMRATESPRNDVVCTQPRPRGPEILSAIMSLIPLLGDPDRAVRLMATMLLASVPRQSFDCGEVLEALQPLWRRSLVREYMYPDILPLLPREPPRLAHSLALVARQGLRDLHHRASSPGPG